MSQCYRSALLHEALRGQWSRYWIMAKVDRDVTRYIEYHGRVIANYHLFASAFGQDGAHLARTRSIFASFKRCLDLTAQHGIIDPKTGCLPKADADFLDKVIPDDDGGSFV